MYSLKNNLKFIIPSLIGIFIFICPIKNENDEVTVPVAFIDNKIFDFISLFGDNAISYIVAVIMVISVVLRLLCSVFGRLVCVDIGPIQITSEDTGGTVFYDLLPTLFAVFLIAGFLLPLLLNYGLLEFIGTLFRKLMRPIFTLPGRSTVDN